MFLTQILLLVGAAIIVSFLVTACFTVPANRPITGC